MKKAKSILRLNAKHTFHSLLGLDQPSGAYRRLDLTLSSGFFETEQVVSLKKPQGVTAHVWTVWTGR